MAPDRLPNPRIITLLTDFGLADTYAGQVHGAILSINLRAVIVDLTHAVEPQDVRQGAFLLQGAIPAFPDGTIHVAVVDPGVGSARRALAIETSTGWFVGPDNGVLSAALPDDARPSASTPRRVTLPAGCRAVDLVEPRYQLPVPSITFHGRDIFGPAAAYLSLGVPLEEFGPPVSSIVALPPFRARRGEDGRLQATVVVVDHFGNVVTDCRRDDLPDAAVLVTIRGRTVAGLVHTYATGSGLTALIGSSGYLEVAVPDGNAASTLGAAIGDEVIIAVGQP